MRNLNGLKWICLLTVISSMANADLILDSLSVIDGQNIELIGVDPLNGDIYIKTYTADYTVTKGDVTPPPSSSVVINSFSATASINEGGSTFLSWTTSGAESCAASGAPNWSGTVLTSGSRVPVVIEAAGTYTLTLTCQGTNGPKSRSQVVVVTAIVVNQASCSTPPLSGTSKTWLSYWGYAFPGPKSDTRLITVPRNGYVALQFNTGNIVDDAKMTSIETTITDGIRLASYSECPGDFDVPAKCSYSWGIGGGLRWATNGLRDDACQLKPNTTYYFNLTFTNGFDSTASSCRSAPCVTSLQYRNR